MWQFAVFQISDPIFFAIFKFAICRPKFVADLKLLQICKFFIFLLKNTYLKCSNSNFYQIKNSAKQTSRQLLDSFAIKGGNFLEICLILSVLWWKIWKKFCGLAYLRNLRIWAANILHIFEQIWNGPNGILRCLGGTDSWKKPEVENLVALPL